MFVAKHKPIPLRAVGAEGRHLKCSFQQGTALRDGIFFGGGAWAGKTAGRFRFAFSPTLNEFRGRVSAECRVYALQLIPEALTPDADRAAISLFSEARSDAAVPVLSPDGLPPLMASGQGTLLVCRCLKTALALREQFPDTDFCLGEATDSRAFNTILLYGDAARVSPAYRAVVLCDGDTGEGEALKAACPAATMAALPMSEAMKQLLASSFADKDALRNCFIQIKKQPFRDLYGFADACGLTVPQAAFALAVLRDIDLIDAGLSPFRVSLRPMQKRDPEECRLFQLALRARQN